MTNQSAQNLENLAQDFEENPSQNLNNDDENTSKNEVEKLLAKNKELLEKLAKSKNDNKTLLAENETLKNIQSDFEKYKQEEYFEAVLYGVLGVIPNNKDFVKFELEKMGYQVIYADNQLFNKKQIIDGVEFATQTPKTGYCFIDPNGELVTADKVEELREHFASYVYGSRASGSGGYIDPHYPAKQVCDFKDGVFIGKPRIKAQAQAIAELYQSELEKAQRAIEYYRREIPALLATVDSLPNQVLSDDDKLHFGLK